MTDFKNVPEEKFEKMNSDMEKSIKKEIKNLKINYIDIQNFKNIDGISTELYDWNIVWWFNANWKSSFIEAILVAIKGQKFLWTTPASLVKHWENKAEISLKMSWDDTEIIIERILKAWTAKKPAGDNKLIATINWEKISQKSLDTLLNALTLDPLKLWTLSTTEQIKEIKKTTWLNTDEIDQEIEDQEIDRKESRSDKEKTEAIYESSIESWIPEKIEEVNLNDLLKIQKWFIELSKKDSTLEEKKEDYQAKKIRADELAKELFLAKEAVEKSKKEWMDYRDELNKEKDTFVQINWTEEKNEKDLKNTQETNEKASKYKKYIQLKQEKDDNRKYFDKSEEKLEELRAKRTKIIANSDLPKYMKIDEDYGILVDDIEYKLLNTARKIEVGIDLVLISWSPLKMIRIENWGELDVKTIKSIKDKIIDNWFQLLLERPVIDKYDTIIISDWELLDWEEKEDFINNQ